jgi:uncharacterized protein
MRALAHGLLILAFTLGLSWAGPSLAAEPPPAPATHVMDEPGILSPRAKQAVTALLVEHERVTSEQVIIAIFKSLNGEELVDFTNRTFAAWRIGKRGKDNGALLALYWEDRKARIEVGYGLEGNLTDARAKRVLEEFLFPELRAQDPSRGVSLAALEILDALESPLIQNGRALQILRDGGISGGLSARTFADAPPIRGWWVWIIVGFLLLFMGFQFLTTAEAHFTRGGWYRPSPWSRAGRRSTWHSGWGGGGGFGGGGWGGGGGGGFLGGGGRSGGGGASGSW